MTKFGLKNFLICIGAFYSSYWVALLLQVPYDKLTNGIIYTGDFAGAVLLPAVSYLPKAVCAFGVGAVLFWWIESEYPIWWAIFTATLYSAFGLNGHHWARQPNLVDREAQVVGALSPAAACVSGAITVRWWNRRSQAQHAQE